MRGRPRRHAAPCCSAAPAAAPRAAVLHRLHYRAAPLHTQRALAARLAAPRRIKSPAAPRHHTARHARRGQVQWIAAERADPAASGQRRRRVVSKRRRYFPATAARRLPGPTATLHCYCAAAWRHQNGVVGIAGASPGHRRGQQRKRPASGAAGVSACQGGQRRVAMTHSTCGCDRWGERSGRGHARPPPACAPSSTPL